MVAASKISILGGGSLGSEALLIEICAIIAFCVSIGLLKYKYKNVFREHT